MDGPLEQFGERSRRIVANVLETWNDPQSLSVVNQYMGDETRKRLNSIRDYVRHNRQLPGGAVVLFRDNDFYEIVDGCHRLSFFFGLKITPLKDILGDEQLAWVGEQPEHC